MRVSKLSVTAAVLVVGAIVLTGMNGFRIYREATRGPANPISSVSDWHDYFSSGVRVGASDARVAIVVFNDYLCGVCRRFESVLRELVQRHSDSIAVSYHQLPRPDPRAIGASKAAYCAHSAGRFRPFNELVFSLDSLRTSELPSYARRAGIRDTNAFRTCINSAWATKIVKDDSLLAVRLGTKGTPTILVNDEQYRGNPYGFDKILRRHLDSAYGLRGTRR